MAMWSDVLEKFLDLVVGFCGPRHVEGSLRNIKWPQQVNDQLQQTDVIKLNCTSLEPASTDDYYGLVTCDLSWSHRNYNSLHKIRIPIAISDAFILVDLHQSFNKKKEASEIIGK